MNGVRRILGERAPLCTVSFFCFFVTKRLLLHQDVYLHQLQFIMQVCLINFMGTVLAIIVVKDEFCLPLFYANPFIAVTQPMHTFLFLLYLRICPKKSFLLA